MMRTAPSPVRRLARSPAKVITYALLAVSLVLTAVLDARSSEGTRAAIASDWRGAYDILVLGPQASDEGVLAGESGQELVDPNFANITAEPISSELVGKVSQLDDVEISAPVGFLARLGNTMDWAGLSIPLDVFETDPDQAFDLSWEVTGDDGTGARLLQDETGTLRVDVSGYDGVSTGTASEVGIVVDASIGVDTFVADDILTVSLWPLPVAASTVFAIDPAAEQELLGETGRFLDPLLDYSGIAAGVDEPMTSQFVHDLADDDPVRQQLVDLTGRPAPALTGMYGVDSPLAPILRNSEAHPPMHLDLSITKVDDSGSGDAASRTPVGITSLDVSAERRPFAAASLRLPWPGTDAVVPTFYTPPDRPTTLSGLSLDPASDPPEARRPAVVAQPQGFVRAVPNDASLLLDGTGIGQEQTYRSAGGAPQLRLGNRASTGGAPVEVGTYTPAQIDIERSAASYVPMGAYDPGRATVAVPEHRGVDRGTELEPTLHGLGVVAQGSTAVTTLEGARAFGVTDPVTAIRVKVAGVDDYSEAAVNRIESLAAQIAALGLRTFVVAGSSPQDVQVYVPDFGFGSTKPDVDQQVADLGWVDVPFTTLGAAVESETALTGIASQLAMIVIGLTAVALAVALGSQTRTRAAANRTLIVLGWERKARLGWFFREDLAGIALLVIAGVLSIVVAPDSRLGLGRAAMLTLGALLAATGAAVTATSHRTRRRHASLTRGTKKQPTLLKTVGRFVYSDMGMLVLRTAGILTVTCTLAAAGTLLADVTATVGVTTIGELAATQMLPAALALLATGAVSGVVVLTIATKLDTQRSRRRRHILNHYGGWRMRHAVLPEIANFAVMTVASLAGISIITPLVKGAFMGDISWLFWPIALGILFTVLALIAIVSYLGGRRSSIEQ